MELGFSDRSFLIFSELHYFICLPCSSNIISIGLFCNRFFWNFVRLSTRYQYSIRYRRDHFVMIPISSALFLAFPSLPNNFHPFSLDIHRIFLTISFSLFPSFCDSPFLFLFSTALWVYYCIVVLDFAL